MEITEGSQTTLLLQSYKPEEQPVLHDGAPALFLLCSRRRWLCEPPRFWVVRELSCVKTVLPQPHTNKHFCPRMGYAHRTKATRNKNGSRVNYNAALFWPLALEKPLHRAAKPFLASLCSKHLSWLGDFLLVFQLLQLSGLPACLEEAVAWLLLGPDNRHHYHNQLSEHLQTLIEGSTPVTNPEPIEGLGDSVRTGC